MSVENHNGLEATETARIDVDGSSIPIGEMFPGYDRIEDDESKLWAITAGWRGTLGQTIGVFPEKDRAMEETIDYVQSQASGLLEHIDPQCGQFSTGFRIEWSGRYATVRYFEIGERYDYLADLS